MRLTEQTRDDARRLGHAAALPLLRLLDDPDDVNKEGAEHPC